MARKRKDLEEDEQTLRCVCEQKDISHLGTKKRGVDPNLLVQCEQCGCCQHAFCNGLSARDMPEVYYCEECRPELHEVKTKNGRTQTQYNAQLLSDSETKNTIDRRKRRRTLNSRADDILQRVLEQSAREEKRRQRELQTTTDDVKLEDETKPVQVQEDETELEEEDEADDTGVDEGAIEDAEPTGDGGDESGHADAEAEDEQENEPEEELTEEKPEKAVKKRSKPAAASSTSKKSRRKAPPKTKPPAGPTGSPSYTGKFKPKIPSSRISFFEMRKRISTILEFSTQTQTEMAVEEKARLEMLHQQQEPWKDNDLLAKLESLCGNQKQNLTNIEALTAKLLAWQERYS